MMHHGHNDGVGKTHRGMAYRGPSNGVNVLIQCEASQDQGRMVTVAHTSSLLSVDHIPGPTQREVCGLLFGQYPGSFASEPFPFIYSLEVKHQFKIVVPFE